MKNSLRNTLNYMIFAFLFFSASLFFGKDVFENSELTSAEAEAWNDSNIFFVIDAGHGGEDGGGEGFGLIEKELNLDISKKLEALCVIFGFDCRLTREDDRLLYDYYGDLSDYTGKRKTYDLRNRLKITEEYSPDLFISIHMNKFSMEKYRGAQVYFSPNDTSSEHAAKLAQTYIKNYLDPSNERAVKRANQSIYLLNRMKTPAILIECGFLSNSEEASLLSSEAYRNKLAAAIFAASAEFVVNH